MVIKFIIKVLKVIKRQVLFLSKQRTSINNMFFEDSLVLYHLKPKNRYKFKQYSAFKKILYVKNKSKQTTGLVEEFGRYFYYTKGNEVLKSNASVQIFDFSPKEVSLKISSNTEYVAFSLKDFIISFYTNFYTLLKKGFFLNKILWIYNMPYLLFERKNKGSVLKVNARRYIPISYSRLEFMQKLKTSSINAVMLRWFDDIEKLGGLDEDIDILIEDVDIGRLESILAENVGILPLDVYSVSALPGSSYHDISYYPKDLALKILDTKIVHKFGFYVPSTFFHLVSLSYHAIYHKGNSANIGLINIETKITDHDYTKVLEKLLIDNKQYDFEVSIASLYKFIEIHNFSPSYDTLLKLKNSKSNKCYDLFIQKKKSLIDRDFKEIKGLTIFFIRELAYRNIDDCISIIKNILTKYSFELLLESEISLAQVESSRHDVRGGNWGKGNFECSGGNPKYFLVVYDPFLTIPNEKLKLEHPNLENEKIINAKNEIRNTLNNKYEGCSFNGIHSSDDFYETIYNLKSLQFNRNKISDIIFLANKIALSYKTNFVVIKDLTRIGNRSKVELINYNDKKAVKKTFSNLAFSHFKRERDFLVKFGNESFIPTLYEIGKNYIIQEYFDKVISFENYQQNLNIIQITQIAYIIKFLYDKNQVLIDFNPSNVLVHRNKVFIIDFEFAQSYPKPKKIEESYDLSRVPHSFVGDLPMGYNSIGDFYEKYWRLKIKMSKSKFLSLVK